ncbi:histone-like nucleoid-structuring protein Lsr2 [Nocardioides acrostichi]|uniref:Lsr2 family protein n=1 Tax=Nocardioides acrostichi TaxID=2784339 RepID=A0A930Y6Q0_9ACTN|nr:Lsr2 family protein [Nocardioides acrostichi]MBF4162605.1 Lsr2 family protein [Nocardioides acrostichi]
MAQRVQIILEDDIDGSEGSETVSFGLDGQNYEIDLNEKHAAELREVLAGYIGHGRRASGGSRTRRSSGSSAASAGGPSPKEIREWGRANGYEVPDRGRIPADVREAFDAAH